MRAHMEMRGQVKTGVTVQDEKRNTDALVGAVKSADAGQVKGKWKVYGITLILQLRL